MTAPEKRRNKSGAIGTAAETAVVRWLQNNGWPGAERRRLRGRDDAGDITGMPGLLVEIKGGNAAANATDAQLADWLDTANAKRYRLGDYHAVLIVKRKAISGHRAGEWWAVMGLLDFGMLIHGSGGRHSSELSDVIVRTTLAELAFVLRAAGYGTPLDGGAA